TSPSLIVVWLRSHARTNSFLLLFGLTEWSSREQLPLLKAGLDRAEIRGRDQPPSTDNRAQAFTQFTLVEQVRNVARPHHHAVLQAQLTRRIRHRQVRVHSSLLKVDGEHQQPISTITTARFDTVFRQISSGGNFFSTQCWDRLPVEQLRATINNRS